MLLAALILTASLSAHAVDTPGLRCPVFEKCNERGCTPLSATEPGVTWLNVEGVRVPDTRTNFPIVNAGLHFLHQSGATNYLSQAVRTLCTRPPAERVRCDDELFLGKAPSLDSPELAFFDVWDSTGYVPEGRGSDTQLGRAEGACLEYARIDENLAEALRPSIQLQSSNLSEEGIRLRAQLMKLLAFAPVVAGRCAQEAAVGSTSQAARACLGLATYFDDLRFALLLADKLTAEAAVGRTWTLLRATGRSVLSLAALAVNSTPLGTAPDAYLSSIAALVSEDGAAVRGAISQAL